MRILIIKFIITSVIYLIFCKFSLSKSNIQAPLDFEADQISLDENSIESIGNSKLVFDGLLISSENLIYDRKLKILTSPSTFSVISEKNKFSGDSFSYDVDQDKLTINNGELYIDEYKARVKFSEISVYERVYLNTESSSYSTCEANNFDWQLNSEELLINAENNIGIAKNTSLNFKGVPLFYSPYLDFSIDGSRKSGIMPPDVGHTSGGGVEIAIPSYFNLAPNYDLLFNPKYIEKRGSQFGSRFRHISKDSSSQFSFDFLPNDSLINENRWSYGLFHKNKITEKITAKLSVNKVSDNSYFNDLSGADITKTSQKLINSNYLLEYNSDKIDASIGVERFQVLQDVNSLIIEPYNKKPEITFDYQDNNEFYFVNLNMKSTKFGHPNLPEARRDIYYPHISLPIQKSFYAIRPNIGLHHTEYVFTQNQNRIKRTIPIYSFDSVLNFERDINIGEKNYIQTLEPRIYYVKIPFKNQSTIPLFDTSISDFNIDQIFQTNRFSGDDRINDADQITFAISSKLIDFNGREETKAVIAQRFYLDDEQVVLYRDDTPRNSKKSDILIGLDKYSPSGISINLASQYSTVENGFYRTTFAAAMDHFDDFYKFGYRLNKNSIEQFDFGAAKFINNEWDFLVSADYSLKDKQIIETIFGLNYNKDCWVFSFTYHKLASAFKDFNNAFFLELKLKGLTNIGPDPTDVIERNFRR